MLTSLIETCNLNAIEPHAYITGILTAIVNGHKQSDIEDLLPWNLKGQVGTGHRLRYIEIGVG